MDLAKKMATLEPKTLKKRQRSVFMDTQTSVHLLKLVSTNIDTKITILLNLIQRSMQRNKYTKTTNSFFRI